MQEYSLTAILWVHPVKDLQVNRERHVEIRVNIDRSDELVEIIFEY